MVSKSGDLDATTRFYYDGSKIVEAGLGTQSTMHQQFIHGTRYIDELVMVRARTRAITCIKMPTGTSSPSPT